MQRVLDRRSTRRGLIGGGISAGLLLTLGSQARSVQHSGSGATPHATPSGTPAATPVATPVTSQGFVPVELNEQDAIVVAEGHTAIPFLRWGDPLFSDAPPFDPENQTPEAQARQFGYNCDWIGYLPLPRGSESAEHGLLVVNHEYTNPELMFPGYFTPNPDYDEDEAEANEDYDVPEFDNNATRLIVETSMAAHGLSVVEVARDSSGAWSVVPDSPYTRRITATTPTVITGLAAGTPLLQTNEDPSGTRAIGTLSNCAGGITPWGTVLTGEENFQFYFGNLGTLAKDDPVRPAHERYGLAEKETLHRWEDYFDRYDLRNEPNEPFRFGWVVEFDPYDPESTLRKRTALGRFKHEGATAAIAPSGQVAFYSGDDERYEYAYKFVTAGRFDPDNREANLHLLDEGTLYVAKFNDDGTGEWLRLVHGEGPLTAAYGFGDQGDVLAKTRLAADMLGATKMDRPEDFEANPRTGKVYLACTNNSRRTLDETDDANPRPNNNAGHIIEIIENNNDHSSEQFSWEIFILAGDPAHSGTWYGGAESVSPFAAPDNLTFDLDGNIWISTDGVPDSLPGNDGVFVAPTEGDDRGRSRQFFSSVPGAECAGPVFNPDQTALWLSVQHPGEGSMLDDPSSMWPDASAPPRPSVVLITSDDPTRRVGQLS